MKTAILTSTFLLLLQSMASANTLSYTATVPLQATDISQSVSVQQFNSALGTLNSITVQLSGTYTISSLIFVNNSASVSTFKGSSGVTFIASGGGFINDVNDPGYNPFTIDASSSVNNGNSIRLAAGATSRDYATSPFSLTSSNSITSDVDSANFGLYQGNSTVAFLFQTAGYSLFSITGGNNLQINQIAKASGTVTVTYNYTAVPEPVVPVFSGLVVIGFALVGRHYGQVRLENPS